MSIFETISDGAHSAFDKARSLSSKFPIQAALDQAKCLTEYLPWRKGADQDGAPAEPSYENPLFVESGTVSLDAAAADVEVVGYRRYADDLQEQQETGLRDDGAAMVETVAQCNSGQTLGRSFITRASAEERVNVHAQGFIDGIRTDQTLIPLIETAARVGDLRQLEAQVQAQLDPELSMEYRAQMVNAVTATLDQEYIGRFRGALDQGNPHPSARITNVTLSARDFVNELLKELERISSAPERELDVEIASSPTEIPPVGGDSAMEDALEDEDVDAVVEQSKPSTPPEAPDLRTWIKGKLAVTGLSEETAQDLCTHLLHTLEQWGVAQRYQEQEYGAGRHTSIANLVVARVREQYTDIPNLPDVLGVHARLMEVVSILQRVQDTDPEARAQIGHIFTERIHALLDALPATDGESDVDTATAAERTMLDAIEAQIAIYADPDADIDVVHGAIEEVRRLVEPDQTEDEAEPTPMETPGATPLPTRIIEAESTPERTQTYSMDMNVTVPMDHEPERQVFVFNGSPLVVDGCQASVQIYGQNTEPRVDFRFQGGSDWTQSLTPLIEFDSATQPNAVPIPIGTSGTHAYKMHLERVGPIMSSSSGVRELGFRAVCEVIQVGGGLVEEPERTTGSLPPDQFARVEAEIASLGATGETLRGPLMTIAKLGWRGTSEELELIRRVQALAQKSNIPIVGPGVAGFASILEGTLNMREGETFRDRLAIMKPHVAAWLKHYIEGTVDLATLIAGAETGGAIGELRDIAARGALSTEAARELPSLVMRAIAEKLLSGIPEEDYSREAVALHAVARILVEATKPGAPLADLSEGLTISNDSILTRLRSDTTAPAPVSPAAPVQPPQTPIAVLPSTPIQETAAPQIREHAFRVRSGRDLVGEIQQGLKEAKANEARIIISPDVFKDFLLSLPLPSGAKINEATNVSLTLEGDRPVLRLEGSFAAPGGTSKFDIAVGSDAQGRLVVLRDPEFNFALLHKAFSKLIREKLSNLSTLLEQNVGEKVGNGWSLSRTDVESSQLSLSLKRN
ncbi:hypothetical protein KBB12_00060 [Candidatus Woesebacteria bacterium]|nr:hypothetical protein [Candidatus Woesebacteria bacterium]